MLVFLLTRFSLDVRMGSDVPFRKAEGKHTAPIRKRPEEGQRYKGGKLRRRQTETSGPSEKGAAGDVSGYKERWKDRGI